MIFWNLAKGGENVSEQLIEFISAIIGILALFGFIGIGCAIYEIIITMFEDRRRKKVRRHRQKQKCKVWSDVKGVRR